MDKEKLAEFSVLATLGAGACGKIYKVRRSQDNNTYAMKEIPLAELSAQQQQEAFMEARLLASLNSPYIVKFFESFVANKSLHIVMELCDKGDLASYLARQMGRLLPEELVWNFFLQLCLGLESLHSRRIIHRDVKSKNTFLTGHSHLKIGDLGLAKPLSQVNSACYSVGTPYYLSPEVIEEKPYNEKNDVWGLGCILYELLTLKHPFEARSQQGLMGRILSVNYNPVSREYSAEVRDLVAQCLNKDADQRPSVTQILLHCKPKVQQLGIVIPAGSVLHNKLAVLSVPGLPLCHSQRELETAPSSRRTTKREDRHSGQLLPSLSRPPESKPRPLTRQARQKTLRDRRPPTSLKKHWRL